jgi:hypothetical protein
MNDSDAFGRTFREPPPDVLTCEGCGGEFFYEVKLNRYSASAYSSVVGGDLEVIGHTGYFIRICVCGRPVSPNISGGRVGRTATEGGAVITAVEEAHQVQEKRRADLAEVIKGIVPKGQFNELTAFIKSQFKELAGRIKVLEEK